MKTFVLIFLLLFFQVSGIAATPSEPSNNLVLVTATPGPFKFVRKNSHNAMEIAPSTWSVALSDVKVVQGNSEAFPKKLRVLLDAQTALASHAVDRIVVLLDMAGGQPRVVYWSLIAPIACVPEELIDPRYSEYYFKRQWLKDPVVMCTFVDKYRSPPESQDK